MRNGPRRRESSAALARELVAAKTRGEAAAAIERWRAVLSVSDGPNDRPTSPATSVGIWRPASVDGRTWFVRDAAAPDGRSWADVDRIGPKRGRRVVLLGESCARGWPLDPFFNCASALEACLRSAAGRDAVEVVDLARLAIDAPALIELLKASTALEPDLYVIFAGNNWIVHAERAGLRQIAGAVERGWHAVAACCRHLLRAQLANWTTELTRIVATSRTPALFVIPAENILDFPLAATLYSPLLASDRQIVRDELLERIGALQAEGRLAESEPLAAELVALEDGCSLAGLQALGRCALARGAIEEATRLFENARELLTSLPVAGMSSYVTRSEELRAGLAAAGVPIVDLPRVFATLGGGAPPGREWFYDDCHMTARGIAAAMAAVAEVALPILGVPPCPDVLARRKSAIDPRAEAQADCVAALINAHDERLVQSYATSALAKSRPIGEVLRHYLDLRLSRVPRMFSPAFHRLRDLQGRFPALRHLDTHLTDQVRPVYQRDAMQTRILADAIARDYPEAPSHCAALLRRKYAGHREAIDVLAQGSPGDVEVLGQFPVQKPRAYVRCFRQRVHFRLAGKASSRRWRFQLTTRGHHPGSMGKPATLLVNGEMAATWIVSDAWTTVDGVYESPGRRPEVDVLTVVWPDPEQDRDERVRHVGRAFAESASWMELMSDVYTIWGEIQAFTACARVAEAESRPPALAVGSCPSF
ncbi:MAG: hypothetical protein ACRD26_09925 [Vicinamibacterales bacterium]